MQVPDILFGTGASSAKDEAGLGVVVDAAISCGIRAFDTAPSYGTEKVLGSVLSKCLEKRGLCRGDVFIQTKIDAWQMQDGDIPSFVDKALSSMGLDHFDALLIHWPVPVYFDATWKAFASLKREGLVRLIGVCNVRMRQLERLVRRETVPDLIQIERSPLRTCVREMDFCKAHGISVQAYSPLCKMDSRIKDSPILGEFARRHCCDVGQLVLRWHQLTGAAPIFTSTKKSRVEDYSAIGAITLTDEEIEAVNGLNEDYKLYLESFACPGF